MAKFAVAALVAAVLAAVAHADYTLATQYSDASCTTPIAATMSTFSSCSSFSGPTTCQTSSGMSIKYACVTSAATSLPYTSLPNGLVSVYYSDNKCTTATSAAVTYGCMGATSTTSYLYSCSGSTYSMTAYSASNTFVLN